MRKATTLSIAVTLLLLASGSPAQQDPEALAARLIEMRSRVDTLQSQLNVRREEHKNRMAWLTAQLAELEANRDREALRVRQLDQELEKSRPVQAPAPER